MNTDLSAKYKMQTTETLAVKILRYNFRTINWHQEEIQEPERQTRKVLTVHGLHHPRADTDRFIRPQKRGGNMTDAGRRNLHSVSYKIDGVCRK